MSFSFILSLVVTAPDPWAGAVEVQIRSTADGTLQPAMFYVPEKARPDAGGTPVPLLVGLHTWSGDYRQPTGYLAECQRRGWVFIQPNFRGPNRRPEACASDAAVQDVLDAVAYAQQHARVETKRIYLVGASGGGHMALVMAHRAPHLWAGISSWVPLSDLAAWYRECREAHPPRRYYQDVERVCGGPPGRPETDAQYHKRSPLFHLTAARGVPIDLNAGIHDGHTGSVPISHTLRAFNALAEANGHPEKVFSEADIRIMVREERVPPTLAAECETDPSRQKKVLLRRTAGSVRVTIFEGGHEIEVQAALDWLSRQVR